MTPSTFALKDAIKAIAEDGKRTLLLFSYGRVNAEWSTVVDHT